MIVGVLNVKGGVAKTTSSMGLAAAARAAGRRVRVVDTDPQGTATLWAQAAEDAGRPLPWPVLSANKAEVRRWRTRRPDADGAVVVIDCPADGDVLAEAIRTADFVVVPSKASPVDLQQTTLTCASCEDAGRPHAVLVCMARTGTRSLAAFRQVAEVSGLRLFHSEIPLREDIQNAFGTDMAGAEGYAGAWHEIEEALA